MSAVSPSYPISAPVEFTVTSGGDGILCNAEGFTTGDTPAQNVIVDFVATNPSDLLFRQSGGTANTLERLAVGAVGDVLTVGGSAAVAQTQTVTAVAEAAVPQSSYFLLNTPSTGYYIWYNKTGGGTDPGLTPGVDLFIPPGSARGRTGAAVALAGGETAVQVADATVAVISALNGAADFLATNVGGTSAVMTIVNLVAGVADLAADGIAGTTFVFGAGAPLGVSPTLGWATPTPGSTGTTFMAINTASPGTVAAGSTWVTVAAANATWSTGVFGGHDAGGLFTAGTGIFLVPGTGTIWDISAVVEFEGNNSGNGGGGIPGRRAVRQVRIFNVTAGTSLAVGDAQTNSSNNNSTQVHVTATAVLLAAADNIVVQVRHDANSALSLEFEDETGVAAPVTYFSGSLVA